MCFRNFIYIKDVEDVRLVCGVPKRLHNTHWNRFYCGGIFVLFSVRCGLLENVSRAEDSRLRTKLMEATWKICETWTFGISYIGTAWYLWNSLTFIVYGNLISYKSSQWTIVQIMLRVSIISNVLAILLLTISCRYGCRKLKITLLKNKIL